MLILYPGVRYTLDLRVIGQLDIGVIRPPIGLDKPPIIVLWGPRNSSKSYTSMQVIDIQDVEPLQTPYLQINSFP